MFCSKCGKPLTNSALFCTFCGAAVADENISVPSAAATQTVPVPNLSEPATSAAAVSDSVRYTPDTPVTAEPIGNTEDSTLVHSAAAGTAVSTPDAPVHDFISESAPNPAEPSENLRTDTAETNPPPAPVVQPAIHIKSSEPEKQEKYYTFGHLALCLAAVAVMAIVAGVFAGLYFSVI